LLEIHFIAGDTLSRVSFRLKVRSSSDIENKAFYIALGDKGEHIKRLSFDATFVEEMNIQHFKHQEGNRVFGVSVPEYTDEEEHIQMIKYSCCSSLRPVPILIQTKVRIAGEFCRVGIKLRANPSNKGSLVNLAILMPVPPEIDGETAKMSRRGGMWDSMKRIITWTLPQLRSGETMEVQSQFEFAAGEKNPFPPKFPVLVRFDSAGVQLSGIQVHLIADDESLAYVLDLERSFRVVHRKL